MPCFLRAAYPIVLLALLGSGLSAAEAQPSKLLAEGLSVKEVAKSLDRSVKTIEVHKYNLMSKLDVHDRAGLVKFAIAHRLVQVPVFEVVTRPRSRVPGHN